MKITNRFNLPDTIVKAVENDPYSKGDADYSGTQLIAPVQQVILKNRHEDEISEDASDRIWSLLGKSVHSILEAADIKDAIQEGRIFAELVGKKISGAGDLYHKKVISDYKVTSVWTAMNGSRMDEWTAQLNIYAYLFESIGFPVEALEVVAIYRDWSYGESKQYGERYPQKAERVSLELWPMERRKEFIEERLRALINVEGLLDDELPHCTSEEMWEKPDTWAVYKGDAAKASRVLKSPSEAEAWRNDQKKPLDYKVVHRPGERTRCEKYCPVREFCHQYKTYRSELQEVPSEL